MLQYRHIAQVGRIIKHLSLLSTYFLGINICGGFSKQFLGVEGSMHARVYVRGVRIWGAQYDTYRLERDMGSDGRRRICVRCADRNYFIYSSLALYTQGQPRFLF